MWDFFNKTFLRFTLGFISILVVSFALAVFVSHLQTKEQSAAARAPSGDEAW